MQTDYQNLVTPQSDIPLITAYQSDTANTTPTLPVWGTGQGLAPRRRVQWTPPNRRGSFGQSLSAGIPVTIEEEPVPMEIDSTSQAPSIPPHIFGSRHPNRDTQRRDDPTQRGFAFITSGRPTSSSRAGQATQNNFFHAKRVSGNIHRSLTPKWESALTTADSDPGTSLARQARMKELDLADLVLMRQRQRELQQVLNSRRAPRDALEKLWIDEGLSYDTRTGGFVMVIDEEDPRHT